MKISDIVESFDSDIPGVIIRQTPRIFATEARIGNRDIVFNADFYKDGMDSKPVLACDISFYERSGNNATYGKSGSGNEMKVFSFVVDSVKKMISIYSPDKIRFTSEKSDMNRTRLYSKMIKKISIPGYILDDIRSDGFSDIFTLVKVDNFGNQ